METLSRLRRGAVLISVLASAWRHLLALSLLDTLPTSCNQILHDALYEAKACPEVAH